MIDTQTLSSTPRCRYLALVLCAGALGLILLGLLTLFAAVHFLDAPTEGFPIDKHIRIVEGSSLRDISIHLEDAHVIRSPLLFRVSIMLHDKQASLNAGAYVFTKPHSTLGVARAFIDQSAFVPLVRVTIPEGATLSQFDALLASALPAINAGDIVRATEQREGVLFPDTYDISEYDTAEDIVKLLSDTFERKLAPFRAELDADPLSQGGIIILASLVEKEAKSPESMKLVAGILRTRLERSMPLQVDATFAYELGKTSDELTHDDLHNNSPYNTYRLKGLPPTPINSPGLTAIDAVLHPTASDYLYYLTDRDGNFHYAKTFDEHKLHKAQYLR